MCTQILGFSRVRVTVMVRVRVSIRSVQFNWFVLVLWTIMWRDLLNQLAIFGDIALCQKKASPKIGDILFLENSVPEIRGHSFLPKNRVRFPGT